MGFVVVQVSQELDFCIFFVHLNFFLHGWSSLQQQQQAGSELNVHLDDVIHEQCPNVSVYTNIYLMMLNNPSQMRRGDKKAKTSKIIGFHAVKNGKRSSNGPPFESFSREK